MISNVLLEPKAAEKYLKSAFGEKNFDDAKAAFEDLAASFEPDQLKKDAFHFYEQFRPAIPAGQAGWGRKGVLDLDVVAALKPKYK